MACGADPIWISVWQGKWPVSHETFTFSLFQCGGTGARATKDGLNTTGFPSGVAGVPAEVMESLTPLVQYRRELRADSGGPGTYRGGLGNGQRLLTGATHPGAFRRSLTVPAFPLPGLR